jgi:hypothetical protein
MRNQKQRLVWEGGGLLEHFTEMTLAGRGICQSFAESGMNWGGVVLFRSLHHFHEGTWYCLWSQKIQGIHVHVLRVGGLG